MPTPDLNDLIRTAAPALLAWLLTYAVHSTIFLGGAWLASRRIRSHAVRETVWKTALFGGFLTATAQSVLAVAPLGGRVVVSAAAARAPALAPDLKFDEASGALAARPDDESGQADAGTAGGVSSGTRLGAGETAILVWLAGAAALLALYFLRRRLFARRIASRRPVMTHPLAEALEVLSAEAGIVRPIRLTASGALASPIALGTSEIAVPEAALSELDPDQQRGMLAHELAHLERRDPAWLAAACVAERIAFFQPLNRLARRRMQESAEYLCDEWAVRRTGSGVFLAKCLAKVAEWMDASPRAVPVAGMAEERSHLVARVRRLLDGAPFSGGPGRRTLVAVAVLTVVVAAMAAPGVSLAKHQADPGRSDSQSETGTSLDPSTAGKSQDTTRAIIRALAEAMKDPDLEVRRAAIRSLSRFHDRSTLPAFREAIRDADAEVRATAIHAVAEMKDRGAGDAVLAALRDESPEVRHAAAEAIAELKPAGAREPLLAALRDPNPEVRAHVVGALAQLKDPAALEGLTTALRDPKADVRARAIEAIVELEVSTAPAALLEALRDPSAEVRHQAAHAMGHFQDVRAIPTLRALITDPNEDVREAAVEALAEIRTEAAIDALMSALKSKDPKVRRAAADALGQRSEG